MNKRTENIIIVVGWTMLFVLPALYLLYESVTDETDFDTHELWNTWGNIVPFLLMFCIHHYLMIRMFSKRQFTWYAVTATIILGCYAWYQIEMEPARFKHIVKELEKQDIHIDDRPHMPSPYAAHEHERQDKGDMHHARPLPPPGHHNSRFEPKHFFLRAPIMGRLVIALLMMGMDLGALSLINSERTRRRLLTLEKENLEMQLDYLKYQINPHFFMNTLNNIHALVDIDNEKAKRTIIDLSKLMRYVLYDSSMELVPLDKEIQFINLYVSLMELRFSSKVMVEIKMPSKTKGVMIPPLLFICFVENAFKHGINTREQSFINIYATLDESLNTLSFVCINSKSGVVNSDNHHGIGIENTRKRLELIYGEDYSLKISNEDTTFEIWLQIPIKK